MKSDYNRFAAALPLLALVAAATAVVLWLTHQGRDSLTERLPGADEAAHADGTNGANPVLAGRVIAGDGQPANLAGSWPQFRGPNRDDASVENLPLTRTFSPGGPRQLWAVDCGEGYAGAAVRDGRVYLMDYDSERKQNALRCLSLADGREIWRYAYTMQVKRNHGMTRTVPAVTGKFVVAIDPKCNVLCLDSATGERRWGLNMVHEFGAAIPPWYTGQCPLIDGQNVILAPGGSNALMVAVDIETGAALWRAPNPHDWKMTHSSVMAMDFGQRHFYVYCGSGGVTGISATNGALLWDTDAWKISIANVPSPLVLDGGKILLAGGYNAGSELLQLQDNGSTISPQIVWRQTPEVFGATQHTPIYHNGHIFGTRPDGKFVCLGLDGKIIWSSPSGKSYGMGPFLFADGIFLVMNESGNLSLIEDSGTSCNVLGQAQLSIGHESWAPMALAGGRLLARDFTRLVCLEVASPGSSR